MPISRACYTKIFKSITRLHTSISASNVEIGELMTGEPATEDLARSVLFPNIAPVATITLRDDWERKEKNIFHCGSKC